MICNGKYFIILWRSNVGQCVMSGKSMVFENTIGTCIEECKDHRIGGGQAG